MTVSRSGSDALGELDPRARLRVRVAGLTAALVTALLVLAGGPWLRQPLYDAYQTLAPAPDVSSRVQVVVIDADSIRDVGGWPWTRFYLAALTDRISELGAAAIGFDLLFAEPDRHDPSEFAAVYGELPPEVTGRLQALPSGDDAFRRAIGRAPVVLARAGVDASSFDRVDGVRDLLPPEAQFDGVTPKALKTYPTALSNIQVLDGASLGHGLVNGERDADGLVRRVPLAALAGGHLTPGFAAELVRIAEGQEKITLEGGPGGVTAVRIGRHRVPSAPDGQVLLRFADWQKIQTISAVDVLRQGLQPDAFKDKIVLVGLAAAGTSDVTSTPRARAIYGVFVQAQTVDAILRGSGLRRPPWAPLVEWGVAALFIALSFRGVPRVPMGPVILFAAVEILAVFGATMFAFTRGLLIDPYPMLLPGAANSAVMVALLFVEGRRVQRRLRDALEGERLAAARISGELAAASEIQTGMLLPRAELARVSPVIEVDAVVQSAKTVGGDLYDAFRFDDGRVCFLVGDVTGKGVPASLFMALSKALSRSLLMRPRTSLAEAVAEINAELSRDNRQAMAVSLLVGVLRPEDGDLELCCAGHENPLVVGVDGSVREIALDGGPALCVDETFPYPAERHVLAPGEMLVAFTDGLTEAQAPDGALFSRRQLFAAVADAAHAPSLPGVVDALVERVRAFEAGGEPSDDLTVLAVRRRAAA
ncbi:MAG: CHASE2 domain-containing protein [Pseudomonadota bacterium]